MALHVSENSDFSHRYNNDLLRRPDLSSRYRANGLRTERSFGNSRYKNQTASQINTRYSGSHLPYQSYDGLGPHTSYDPTLSVTTTNLGPSARKASNMNCRDTGQLQTLHVPYKMSSTRLSQHDANPIFTDEFPHRGALSSDRMYVSDVTRMLDTKRYAPSNYRLPANVWNSSKDGISSDYDKFRRSPKGSHPYSTLNNHAVYDIPNNSSYISEGRFYAASQAQQKSAYLSAYLGETSGNKQNQCVNSDRRNGHENPFPMPYRSGLNVKDHNGYRTKSFPSVSLNNLSNIDNLKFEKNGNFIKDLPNGSKALSDYEDRDYEEEPLTPAMAKQKYAKYLTAFEKDEISFYPEVYFVGQYAKKRQPVKNLLISGTKEYSIHGANNSAKCAPAITGYDDPQSGYIVVLNDHIAYRYEVIKLLGKGSFGQVVQARDHKTGHDVALKIIRSKEIYARQAKEEIQILKQLNEQDPEDNHNIVRLLDNFKFREHVCMVFELLSVNLYELLHFNEFKGLQQAEVRAFTKSILECLELLFK
ncbi:Dual specificity tyrosine-phosphorylation-regulated kinase 2 [Fasciolopsis buskii]|uniref:dual-specificity kinase n=1 Tax=Fasciolopsis buskii TaxID=27845 RepID=A0A8E0S0P1_9TREM|nr:Dual specificity tyrosine-phosphorylation-regulated kinase 2 [Fasciolopsis buski]